MTWDKYDPAKIAKTDSFYNIIASTVITGTATVIGFGTLAITFMAMINS
jgi:hypothetical protein